VIKGDASLGGKAATLVVWCMAVTCRGLILSTPALKNGGLKARREAACTAVSLVLLRAKRSG